MKPGSRVRNAVPLLVLAILVGVGLVAGGSEEVKYLEPGHGVEIGRVLLVNYGSPIVVMGQLTMDGKPVEGTCFVLFNNPFDESAKETCGLQIQYSFPKGVVANGAQISYILYPNSIVTFSIAPSQFQLGCRYDLPFLPEDPPGAGALEFFD